MKKILSFSTLTLLAIATTGNLANAQSITWTNTDGSTSNGASATTTITGGPWTLGNGPVVPGTDGMGDQTQTLNYCGNNPVVGTAASTARNTSDGTVNGTNLTNIFQPYYFPFIVGQGQNLQGYFDYRPKDTNEAIVAAYSQDGGQSWTFQQEAVELNPGLCPTATPQGSSNNATVYPSKKNAVNPYPNSPVLISLNSSISFGSTNYTSPGATDAGQGHPFVSKINGVNYLYTLDRSVNPLSDISATYPANTSADNLGLIVHTLSSATPAQPLGSTTDTPLTSPDVTLSGTSYVPNISTSKGTRTTGLIDPDGIIAEVPGSSPRIVLYLSKILSGDNTGSTALPTSEQCVSPTVGQQAKAKVNHDISNPRLAVTSDGIHFTDLGLLTGLNDPTTISYTGTRWIAPTGTLIKIASNHFGLFFAGGNCVDADSDSFHYIGYAESTNLRNWTVINGINNPIASITLIPHDGSTLPDGTTFTTDIPANPPLINYNPVFAGRVYSPNAILIDPTNNLYALFVAGYNTKSPSSNYSSYRTITRFVIKRTVPVPQP